MDESDASGHDGDSCDRCCSLLVIVTIVSLC